MEGVYRMQNINLGWKFQKLPGMDIRALSALPEVNEAEAETVDLPHTWYQDGALRDEAVFCGVAEKDESYLYVDKNPGINVKNWFVDAVEEEKMFPTGMFSIRDGCNTIVESDEAMAAVEAFSPKLAEQMRDRRGMMPLERILNYMKNEFSEEDCKRLNAALTKVKKH